MVICLTRGWGITGILLVLAVSSVFAQPSSPLPPAAEQALRRGLVAAQQEAWDVAIRHFTEAQQAAPDAPEVLFNLGLAHARAGREILGALWLRAYLTAAPASPNAAQVRQEIDRLEVAVDIKAQQLFTQALTAARQLPLPDRMISLAHVAKEQARARDFPGALRTVSEFENEKEKLTDSDRANLGLVGALLDVNEVRSLIWRTERKFGTQEAEPDPLPRIGNRWANMAGNPEIQAIANLEGSLRETTAAKPEEVPRLLAKAWAELVIALQYMRDAERR